MERRDFLGCAMLASVGAAGTALAQTTSETAKPTQKPKGVRITVLRRSVQQDFQKYRSSEIKACDQMKDGQEFIAESPWNKPQGMCDWAWADVRTVIPYVYTGQWKQTVSCCTDGYRPVFFLIEQLT